MYRSFNQGIMKPVTGIASQTGDTDQSSEKINTKIVTTQPYHYEAVFAEAVSRFYENTFLEITPVPSRWSRIEIRLFPRQASVWLFPRQVPVAGAASIDKSVCFFDG